jgi:hypothetical protein
MFKKGDRVKLRPEYYTPDGEPWQAYGAKDVGIVVRVVCGYYYSECQVKWAHKRSGFDTWYYHSVQLVLVNGLELAARRAREL